MSVAEAAVDVRCAHRLASAGLARCQLWAGHSGPHAVMFVRDGQRLVRRWIDQHPADAHDCSRDYEALPWMRGFPIPAWQEHASGQQPAK